MSEPSAPQSRDLPAPDSAGTDQRFPKSARLLRSSQFRRVYDNGFRHSCAYFAAFCLRDNAREGGPRVGFTVPRAVGKAVVRNRVRRRMREALRLRLRTLEGPWDLVFNPRRSVLDAPFDALGREVERLFARCARSLSES